MKMTIDGKLARVVALHFVGSVLLLAWMVKYAVAPGWMELLMALFNGVLAVFTVANFIAAIYALFKE